VNVSTTKRFIEFATKAIQGQVETRLSEVFSLLEMDDGLFPLEKLKLACESIESFGLEMHPGMREGDVDTLRSFRAPRARESLKQIVQEVLDLESPTLELKSSLFYDYKRAEGQPGATLPDLKSEAVCHSALKTINAFLNTKGGVLYIGADDDGNILGVDKDFAYTKDIDGWELCLRDMIQSRFKDGKSINEYIEMSFYVIDGFNLARLKVFPRKNLSCIKKPKSGYAVYARQGNRTAEIGIEDVEEFLTKKAASL